MNEVYLPGMIYIYTVFSYAVVSVNNDSSYDNLRYLRGDISRVWS